MKALPRLLPALLLAALLPGCGSSSRDETNPFAQASRTTPPPASAALLFTSSLYSLSTGAGREIYAVNADGGGLTRLTYCNDLAGCDHAEAAPAPDRERVAARKVGVDNNGDGLFNEADGAGLAFIDLRRGVEAGIVPASRRVSGVDWAPSTGNFYVYSALPSGGGNEDLFVINFNGTPFSQNSPEGNLTCPIEAGSQCNPAVRERRPRLDRLESVVAYQRLDAAGASIIAIYSSFSNQPGVTAGPNDSDPVFSPDSSRIAFRRLTDPSANEGRGSWDILTVALNGTGLQSVATGPAFRGAPDWGPNGLVWAEADAAGQRLMVANPDGSGLKAIVTLPANVALSSPRWLPAQ
jgi:hypothetical protein